MGLQPLQPHHGSVPVFFYQGLGNKVWAGLFKAQFSQPRISKNFDLSFATFLRGFLRFF